MAALADWLTLAAADRLFSASVQGALVIALVWALCRCSRRMPASAHAALWWLASLKLVILLVPVPAVPVPLLPVEPVVEGLVPAAVAPPGVARPAATLERYDAPLAAAGQPIRGRRPVEGSDAAMSAVLVSLIALWLAIVLAHGVRLLRALRALRGILARSVPFGERDEAARLASRVGLSSVPEVRVSGEIGGPQVVGALRPVVLLPEALARLAPREWRLALAHEMVHVRRRDLALGWVPAVAERLFFFHPLARLAAREYLTAREAACDAAVVRAFGVGAGEYGRLLVRLGIGRAEPALAATGASSSASSLKRRLEMLQHAASTRVPRRSAWLAVALLALAVMPFELVARASSGQVSAVDAAAGRQVAPVPAPAPSPAPVRAARQVTPAPAPQAPRATRPTPPAAVAPRVVRGAPAPVRMAVPPMPARPVAAQATTVAPPAPAPAVVPARPARPVSRAVAFAGNQDAQAEELARREARLAEVFEALRRQLEERNVDPAEQRARIEELRQALAFMEQSVADVQRKRAELELALRLEAGLAETPRREARQEQAPAAALARQLEALTRAQQSLIEQQQNLTRQQQQIVAQQRELSEQTEQLRQALERALKP